MKNKFKQFWKDQADGVSKAVLLPSELQKINKVVFKASLNKAENNPFAICTESVGRENKEKYEACVMHLKEKFGIEKDFADEHGIKDETTEKYEENIDLSMSNEETKKNSGRECDNCGHYLSDDDFDSHGSWNYTCPKCNFRYVHGSKSAKEQVEEYNKTTKKDIDISTAGKTPNSLLSRQDIEGSDTEEKSAKDEFTVGDVLDTHGKTNMKDPITIREVSGNTLKFTDSEGKDYQGMSRSTVRNLVNGGSWTKKSQETTKRSGRECDNCGHYLTDDEFDAKGGWSYTCKKCGFRYNHGSSKDLDEQLEIFNKTTKSIETSPIDVRFRIGRKPEYTITEKIDKIAGKYYEVLVENRLWRGFHKPTISILPSDKSYEDWHVIVKSQTSDILELVNESDSIKDNAKIISEELGLAYGYVFDILVNLANSGKVSFSKDYNLQDAKETQYTNMLYVARELKKEGKSIVEIEKILRNKFEVYEDVLKAVLSTIK